METSVTSYWMALNFRYVPEKGKKGKRREHIPLAEGWLRTWIEDGRTIVNSAFSSKINHKISAVEFVCCHASTKETVFFRPGAQYFEFTKHTVWVSRFVCQCD